MKTQANAQALENIEAEENKENNKNIIVIIGLILLIILILFVVISNTGKEQLLFGDALILIES